MIAPRVLRAGIRASSRAAPAAPAKQAIARQSLVNAPRRRGYASSSSESSSASPASGGSDSIWAISSLLVFGGLFVYLTSPSGKGKAKGHQPTPHKKDDDFNTDDEALHNLRKTEDHSDSPLEGNKALAERAHAPDSEGAPQQKTTKEVPTRHDNTTFQKGVAAAKDGDHISDPKKVVAAANAEKLDKANAKQEKKEAKDSQEEEKNDEGEDKEESE